MENDLEGTNVESDLERARARGRAWAQNFYNLPKEEKIEHIAAMIYNAVVLDPLGYPNGQPDFTELPNIDYNHKIGNDKARYIQAAASAYSRLMWKPEEEQKDND